MSFEFSLKVKNYKCFGETEQGFNKILPLNILIGKNNSGKSTLLDLIQYAVKPIEDRIGTRNGVTKCIVRLPLSEKVISKVVEDYAQRQHSNPELWLKLITDHYNDENQIRERDIQYYLQSDDGPLYINNKNSYGQYEGSFKNVFSSVFAKKVFKRINAERDIKAERLNQEGGLSNNGDNSTYIVWKYLNVAGFDQNLIKKEFLNCLNKITSPDIEFVDTITKENNIKHRDSSEAEINFEYKNGQWVALSKMGSGIKTIILTLLNLIVIPKMDGINKENLIFGFEELENNLHPSLQRRLFNYIAEYAEENKSIFFITTHSNIPIDMFSSNKNAQILHVQRDSLNSIAKTIETKLDGKSILKDLDYKASDILFSNGIIWLEGPSDALYLELLLDLYKNKQTDSQAYSYCIQALSTALWKYAGFTDFDWNKIDENIENQIISLAKINHNHIIVIDYDDNYEDQKPSEYNIFKNKTGKNKARLIYESLIHSQQNETELANNFGDTKDGKLFFWINDGTFETYLQYFIQNKGAEFEKYFDSKSLRGYFEKKRNGDNYSKSKVDLAAEIASFSLKNNLGFDDFALEGSPLANKIQRLYETIKFWNT